MLTPSREPHARSAINRPEEAGVTSAEEAHLGERGLKLLRVQVMGALRPQGGQER